MMPHFLPAPVVIPCVATIALFIYYCSIPETHWADNATKHDDSSVDRAATCFGPLADRDAFERTKNDKIECRIDGAFLYRARVVESAESIEIAPQIFTDDELSGSEDWIDSLIDWILSHNSDSRKTGVDHCEMYLSPFRWRQYVLLQKQMAKSLPVEGERPTISLDLRTRRNAGHHRYAFGIVGGVGQLADADILRRVYNILYSDEELSIATKTDIARNMVLKVHSSPPPRPEHFSVGHLFEASQRVVHYTKMMEHFLGDREIEQFLLASNTAHCNLGVLKFVSKFSDPNWFEAVFVNVIESTVHVVQQTLRMCSRFEEGGHRILVIGTTAAHKHRTYPNALESLGLTVLAVEDEEQKSIQTGIDHIKQGKLDIARKIIVDAVRQKIKLATHVIMGCSEISLAVKKRDIHEVRGDILFIDTTEFMAQSVAAWMVMENKRYQWVQKQIACN